MRSKTIWVALVFPDLPARQGVWQCMARTMPSRTTMSAPLGIRVEDNLLITDDGFEGFTDDVRLAG